MTKLTPPSPASSSSSNKHHGFVAGIHGYASGGPSGGGGTSGAATLQDLPINYAISNVLEIVRGSKRHLPCQHHPTEQVKFFCQPCDALLCAECIVSATNQGTIQAGRGRKGSSRCVRAYACLPLLARACHCV